MQKGQMVKCVKSHCSWFTTGKIYPVLAGREDVCLFSGEIIDTDGGMNIMDDDGEMLYVSTTGCQGRFELVDDGDHDA